MRLRWGHCPKCMLKLPLPIPVYSTNQSRLTGIQYYCSCGWAAVELPHIIHIIDYNRWKREQYD